MAAIEPTGCHGDASVEREFTPSTMQGILHLWCVKFLKRTGVLENQTFSSFISQKYFETCSFLAFYFPVFDLYLFYPHKVKKTKKLSINLVDEALLPLADYSGSVSGAKEDKSDLFAHTVGKGGAPIIEKSPLTMECSVVDIYETTGFESFICTIDSTYVEEKHLNDKGKIDYQSLKPVLFEFPTYQYLRTGDVIGKCLSFKSRTC